MLVSAQSKSRHVEKTKEKSRTSGSDSHRRKTHDKPRKAGLEHGTSHHSRVSRVGISSDGLRAVPKEIPHEVIRDREQEAAPPLAGLTHHEGTRRRSDSSGGHRPTTKHLEEQRSKPLPSHNPLSVAQKLSSDPQPLAGHGSADVKLGSGMKGEAKLSAKVVCKSCYLLQ